MVRWQGARSLLFAENNLERADEESQCVSVSTTAVHIKAENVYTIVARTIAVSIDGNLKLTALG